MMGSNSDIIVPLFTKDLTFSYLKSAYVVDVLLALIERPL
jgi:hypothetical protein